MKQKKVLTLPLQQLMAFFVGVWVVNDLMF